MQHPLWRTPLFVLNDDCFINIFQYLSFEDLINVHRTCTVLRDVGDRVCGRKFKRVTVERSAKGISKNEFSDILSTIGESILSIKLCDANRLMFDTVRRECTNLNSLELWNCKEPHQLQSFQNLIALFVNDFELNIDDMKKFFEKNPNLERFSYDCSYSEHFYELLSMLPNLRSLQISNMSHCVHQNQHFQQLLRVGGLTTFSFHSEDDNCDRLLIELGKHLVNLVTLNIVIRFNEETFAALKAFRNLERLSLDQLSYDEVQIPVNTIFPSKLKRIDISRVNLTFNSFLSIVKQLKFLAVFNIGCTDNLDICKSFYEHFCLWQMI